MAILVLGGCRAVFGLDPPIRATEAPDDGQQADGELDDATNDTPDGPDAPTAFACNAGDAALVLCLAFDGSLADGSAHDHSLTAQNVTFEPGVSGQAARFVTGSLLSYSDDPAFDVLQVSMSMWIKPTTLPAPGARAGLLDSASRYRLFVLSDGALRCALSGGGTELVAGPGVIATNVWHHVRCTYDQAQIRIHVNGALIASLTATGALPNATGPTVVGHNNPTGENFDGLIDSVVVSSKVDP
jgi:hypothetical protein